MLVVKLLRASEDKEPQELSHPQASSGLWLRTNREARDVLQMPITGFPHTGFTLKKPSGINDCNFVKLSGHLKSVYPMVCVQDMSLLQGHLCFTFHQTLLPHTEGLRFDCG